jgi:hypothetical protein
MGMVGSKKGQDQKFVQGQWKKEQANIKREEGMFKL